MDVQKPRRLRAGDTIAIVAPASGLAALVPHRLEQATRYLEAHGGFRVKIYPSVTRSSHENMKLLIDSHEENGTPLDPSIYGPSFPCYGSADAIMRAQELMDAFQDPTVHAILCAIGGLDTHLILEYLDFEVLRHHPKIVMGFSDITTLHLALFAKSQLVTFYGPSAICQFGEFPAPLQYTIDHFHKAVCASEPIGSIVPSIEWTDDKTANWFTKQDMEYRDHMKVNAGYQWIRSGCATGRLLGGCLPVLMNVRGTSYMPDLTGAILLLETPEGHAYNEGMRLEDVNIVLGCLRLDGTFTKIAGLVLGRAFQYNDRQVPELLRLVLYHTRGYTFPILYGLDTGHTNPICTLPLGCSVQLDSDSNSFAVLEAGVLD